uniref:Uncharacterized protein n=1 Tax=Anopheles gambiae TaxID=7165 RepID=A0A1S4HFC8_ANOGA
MCCFGCMVLPKPISTSNSTDLITPHKRPLSMNATLLYYLRCYTCRILSSLGTHSFTECLCLCGFRSSFATAAPIVAAFQFVCSGSAALTCSLTNLYPDYEGTFVLQHIPPSAYMLVFSRLRVSTIDHKLLSALPTTVTHVLVNDSTYVINVKVPASASFLSLVILQTKLGAISFEPNFNLSQLTIEQAPLHHIPSSLLNLRSLAYVKINFTPVQNIDVSLFCNLTQLQTIDLKYNKIYSVTASQFSGCTSSLLELLLANNRLKRIIPSVFAPFRRLEVIDLSHNMLESFVGRFQNTEISQLLISNNLLPQIDPCEWVLMPNMTSLFIEKNKLIGVPDCLHKFPNLYSINLENNLLSSVSLAAFAQLKVLQYLRLSWNPIVSFILREDSVPPKLLQIDMRHSRVNYLNVSKKMLQQIQIQT